jgi:predicted Zn-dependent protease
MRRRSGGLKIRLLLFAGIAIFSLMKYWGSSEKNPYTGKTQHINMTPNEEVRMGLQSAPRMAQQHGGLHPSAEYQAIVDKVGNRLVSSSMAKKTPYRYDFHLLRDPQSINAFALPGGQVFITYALFSKLKSEDQLAGVLGHEIGHVLGRHSAERMAKQGLTQGLITAVMAGGGGEAGQMAAQIGNMVNMKYGRQDELESDELGILFMIEAGYDPEQMIGVMEILKASSGGKRVPEFQSTHPDPENRIAHIKAAIKKYKKQ